jgi:multiple sugar transport system substrate-binding protein
MKPTRRAVMGGAAAAVAMGARRARAATELRYLNVESDPASVGFLKQMALDYEAKTGVRVVVETIVGTTLWTKVTTAIKTGRPYDIIDVAQPTQVVLLAQQDQIVPVTEVIDAAGRADFSDVSMVKYKDQLWYFPLMYNLAALYYRRDWLDDAKMAVPTDWAQFQAVCQAIADPAKRRFATSLPYSAGLTPWGNSGFLWAAGVKFYDQAWNVLLDTPEMKPRLTRALDMLAGVNALNAPGQFNMTLLNIRTNFISGAAGIVAGSGSLIQDFETKSPELSDKFVLAPYPGPDGGKGTVTYGGKGLVIGKTANSRAALDFLHWFVSSGKLIDFQLALPMYGQPVQLST